MEPEEPPSLDLWATIGDVRPWGTLVVLMSWTAMFALSGAVGAFLTPGGPVALGASMTGLRPWDAAWRLLASTFLHSGVAHLFFNALSLLVLAPAVERIFTRRRFWIVYTLGGLAASAGSLAWREATDGASLSVGGSGALFALGGAVLAAVVRLRKKLPPTRARALIAVLLFLTAPGFAAGYARPGTDNVAHAAGLASGVVLGALLPLDPRLGGRAAGRITTALAVACVLALAASLALAVRGAS
jgi:membrane associated rhomboid family serine protease